MFKQRSTQSELMDDLSLSSEALHKNLNELVLINHFLGGKRSLGRALNKIYQNHPIYFNVNSLTIADLGCGAGDMLQATQTWFDARKLKAQLVGIDANAFMIDYAKERYPQLNFKLDDIFSENFRTQQFDIIMLNTFCHHFTDEKLIILFKQLISQTRIAIIINDLHRHFLAYYGIKYLSKLCNFSYLAQHDAPLSVLRAFKKSELITLMEQAGSSSFNVCWNWIFRWQLIIWP